jgi:UrcA family protein
MNNISTFALALIASATLITPTVASAAEPETVSSIVRTADLDLSSEAGQRALDRRIVVAAHEVCGSPSPVDLMGVSAVRDCRERTIAAAAEQRQRILSAAKAGTPIILAAAR